MRSLAITIATGGLVAFSSLAHAEFTGNVALTTDYVFRGISQTDEKPAIQGGFDYAHSSGLHAGLWASNVDFNDNNEATVEIDYTAGFGSKLGSNLDWDLSFIYYTYPGAAGSLNYDYWELAPTASYDFGMAKAKAGFYYSNDFFGGTGDAFYYTVGLDVPLPAGFGIGASVGHQDIDKGTDYNDWKVALSKDLAGFGFELAYTDTDLTKAECGSSICDARAVFTISKSL